MIYPYEIKVKNRDDEYIKVCRLLSKRGRARVPSHRLSIKLGLDLDPIREDIFLGHDEKYRRSFVALAPHLDCEIKDFNNYIKVVFKPIF